MFFFFIVGGGRLGVKNCGRWEIGGQNCVRWDNGGQKLWEVGDGHPCVTPLSEVMQVAFDREPFPLEAVPYVTPSHRVRRAAHYMAAMGLWRPPNNPGVPGPLPSSSCNAFMSCSDCFPNIPE